MQLVNNSVSFDCLWWASTDFEFSLFAFHRNCNNCELCTLLQLLPMAAIWIPHHSFICSTGLTLEELDRTISVIYPGHSIIRLLLTPSELQYSTKICQWYSAWVTSLKPVELGKSPRWCPFESPGDQGLLADSECSPCVCLGLAFSHIPKDDLANSSCP